MLQTQLLYAGDDKTTAHYCKKEMVIWVSVGVAVVIAIVLFCIN